MVKYWIANPLTDFIFIFGGVIVALGFNLFPPNLESIPAIIAIVTVLLSGAHMLAPFLLIVSSKSELARVKQMDPQFWKRVLLIGVLPFFLYGLSALLFQSGASNEAAFIPIAVMGAFWVTWNGWHFGMQQFGLMQIYRSIANDSNPQWRRFDYRMAIVFGFIVPTIITFQAGVQEKFLRNYINPRTLLEPIIFPVFLFLLISAVAALVYLYRSRHASLPVLLLYLSMFIQSVLLLHLTFFYLMIAVIMTHWLQEIFLIGRIYLQNQEAKAQIKYDLKRKARFIFGATIVVLTVSGFVGWIQHIPTLRQYRITVSGGFNHWPAMTPNLYWIITMAFATIMSFAILHFYIDKLVHRGRDWSRN